MKMARKQFQTWIWNAPIECVLAATMLSREALRRHCGEHDVPLPPGLAGEANAASLDLQEGEERLLEVPLRQECSCFSSSTPVAGRAAGAGSLTNSEPESPSSRDISEKLGDLLSAAALFPTGGRGSENRRSEISQWLKNQGWSERLARAAAQIAVEQGRGGRPPKFTAR